MRCNTWMTAQWGYEWHHGDIRCCTETIKRFVDRNNVDSRPLFSVVTALPGESIFFPWTNGVDVEVFQKIFSPKVEFLHRPLILPFISWALFDCPKGVARRLKAGLVVTLKRTKTGKGSVRERERKEKRKIRNTLLFFAWKIVERRKERNININYLENYSPLWARTLRRKDSLANVMGRLARSTFNFVCRLPSPFFRSFYVAVYLSFTFSCPAHLAGTAFNFHDVLF